MVVGFFKSQSAHGEFQNHGSFAPNPYQQLPYQQIPSLSPGGRPIAPNGGTIANSGFINNFNASLNQFGSNSFWYPPSSIGGAGIKQNPFLLNNNLFGGISGGFGGLGGGLYGGIGGGSLYGGIGGGSLYGSIGGGLYGPGYSQGDYLYGGLNGYGNDAFGIGYDPYFSSAGIGLNPYAQGGFSGNLYDPNCLGFGGFGAGSLDLYGLNCFDGFGSYGFADPCFGGSTFASNGGFGFGFSGSDFGFGFGWN